MPGLALALGALVLACSSEQTPGHEPDLPVDRALRVVSLSPLASRFVQALGARDQLIGVDIRSSVISGLEGLPVVDATNAAEQAPDLVLVSSLPAQDDPLARVLRAAGSELVEVAPHDLEDVFALCRDLGARLVGVAQANRFEHQLARPLARVGGSSPSEGRPRVVGVVGFEPLRIAGGHSFETDLIEIAGGSSVTHGGSEPRLAVDSARWSALAPQLVLVITPDEPSLPQRAAMLEALPSVARVEFFQLDAEAVWLDQPAEHARRLRALIHPASHDTRARVLPR